jgi:hypothetical protein
MNNRNISEYYITCPICKNIFLKTHIKTHYDNCKKNNNYALEKEKQRKKLEYEKLKAKERERDRETFIKNRNNISPQTTNNNDQTMQIQKYQPSSSLVSYNDSMLNHFFSEYDKVFSQYISGKCIALIGPAQSIIGTKKGPIIDQFDLVVRLNKSLPLPANLKEDIGTKTDIIYNSLNITDFPGQNNLSPRLYKKYDVKFICSPYPFNHQIFKQDILNYVQRYKFEIPLKVMNDFKFRNFERSLGTRPYTGTCAIMDLLSYPIKYLYISGLDFYQTKYYSEYRHATKESLKHTKNGIIHQAKPQLDYLKHVALLDSRIILDEFLDNLLYHDYYKVVKAIKSYSIEQIFNFSDNVFQKYFEMKISNVTFTRNNTNININANANTINNNTYLIFTDNKSFKNNINEYCVFIGNNKDDLQILNAHLNRKKFIANFFYNEHKTNPASIFFNNRFLNTLKSILVKIGIKNCNVNLAILLSIMLYIPDKHFFSYNEIINMWALDTNEKKLILFLSKKNILNLI